MFSFGVYNDSTNVLVGALANNGIVVATSKTKTLSFHCFSASAVPAPLPQFIGLDGSPVNGTIGALIVDTDPDHIEPSEIIVRNKGNDLTAGEEGVYTCHMRNEEEETMEVNIGIYAGGFNSE